MTHPITPDTPTTCKTCGKENIVNWDGQGHCITCARNRILGDTNNGLDELIQRLETFSLHYQKREAINTFMLDTFLELINEHTSNWGNGKDLCGPDELRKAVREWLKP